MAVQTQQKEYQADARPLVTVAEIFPFIYDELGEEVLAKTNEKFKGNKYVELDTSQLRQGEPIGYSNPFRRYAWGDALRQITGWNARPINPRESEIALKEGTLPGNLGEYWEDLGLVLYAEKGSNEKLKQHLLKQAKERGLEIKLPTIATSLSAEPGESFEYSVRLDLGDFGEIYYAPVLKQESGNFDENDPGLVQKGVPDELRGGDRRLHTASSGLRWFYRNVSLDLVAADVYLPDSSVAGRVNFVRFAEGAQNLDAMLANLEAERQRQIDIANRRYTDAMKVIRGEAPIG